MLKKLHILLVVAILLTNGTFGQGEDSLPGVCQGSKERYWVKGFNGQSTFNWRITAADGTEVPAENIVAVNNGSDTVTVNWSFPEMKGGLYTFHIQEVTPWKCQGEEYEQSIMVNTQEIFVPISSFLNVDDRLIDICAGGSFDLEVELKDGSRQFVSESGWLDLNEPFTPTRIISQAGVFTVKVVDDMSACSYDTVEVVKHEIPKVDLGGNQELCLNNAITIDPQIEPTSGSYSYTWYLDGVPKSDPYHTLLIDNNTLEVNNLKTPFDVKLSVQDSYGCVGSDSMKVVGCSIGDLRIPTAFTPNGDGLNDKWDMPDMERFNVTSLSIDVYNRWGKRVYHFSGKDYVEYAAKAWNGKDTNGAPLPVDSYHYIIRFDYDNQRTTLRGAVTIIL